MLLTLLIFTPLLFSTKQAATKNDANQVRAMLVVQGTAVYLSEISEYESRPFSSNFFFYYHSFGVVRESETENKNNCKNTVLVYIGSNSIPR